MNLELGKIKSIHFVGIKGVAMTALAILAQEKGIAVSGSDVEEEFPTDKTLHHFSIACENGFSASHMKSDVDLVVYTGAHQGINNIEVQAAIKQGVQVLSHGKALGLFMEGKRGITVAGSHGKTTASAMIAHILTKLDKDPSFAIGCGEILSLKTSGHAGKGEFFVAEGDEYVTDPAEDATPRFMWQHPEVLIITNIDFDHPDVYKNLHSVKKTFVDFANSLSDKDLVVVNIDDEPARSIISQLKSRITTYGETDEADFQLKKVSFSEGKTYFVVLHKGKEQQFSFKIPGSHNAANATGAIAALVSLGFNITELVDSLNTFMGTKRRFELIAEKNGKLLYDDYAHHPAEIAATLKAAKEWYPGKKLIVVFQPHTYSRTQALMGDFANCFKAADQVLLTEIYASAREKPIPGIHGEALFKAVLKHKTDVHFAPNRNSVLQYLKLNSRPNDLILTMGAGDIFTWLSYIKEIL